MRTKRAADRNAAKIAELQASMPDDNVYSQLQTNLMKMYQVTQMHVVGPHPPITDPDQAEQVFANYKNQGQEKAQEQAQNQVAQNDKDGKAEKTTDDRKPGSFEEIENQVNNLTASQEKAARIKAAWAEKKARLEQDRQQRQAALEQQRVAHEQRMKNLRNRNRSSSWRYYFQRRGNLPQEGTAY